MNRKKRRGFTLVELVIVIAVIAILAAVLIPTFATVIKQAKMSADQRAVRDMNLALQAEEIADQKKPDGVADALSILRQAGFNVDNLAPASTGYEFYWISEDNRVVLVEMNGTVPKAIVYPPELAEKYEETLPQGDEWYKLGPEKGDCTHDPAKYTYRYVAVALVTGGSDYHMVICNNCNTVLADDAPHVFNDTNTCTKCGYIKETSSEQECKHAYTTVGEKKSYYSNNDGTHTKICLICNVAAKEPCQYDTEGVCVFCGYKEPTDGHKHDYLYTPNNDGTHNRSCQSADCPRQDEATATGLDCSYEYDGSVWKCIYCEAVAPESFSPKGGTEGGIANDGFYYKNNRLFTGDIEDDGQTYHFEYGKLVVGEGAPTTTLYYTDGAGGYVPKGDFIWNFDLPNEEEFLTDRIVLRFEDKNTSFSGGEVINNKITFTGGGNAYEAVNIKTIYDMNMPGAIKMLETAVHDGNTETILSIIETIYGFNDDYYPIFTYSKDFQSYFDSLGFSSKTMNEERFAKYTAAAASGNSYTDWLKSTYTQKYGLNVNYLSEIHWEDLANVTKNEEDILSWDGLVFKPGEHNTFLNECGIIGGDPLELNGKYLACEEPEYVLMFWQIFYDNMHWYGVKPQFSNEDFYDVDTGEESLNGYEAANWKRLKLYRDPVAETGTFYNYAMANWKEKVGVDYTATICSGLDLAKGMTLSNVTGNGFYFVSGIHSYFGGNIIQSREMPTQSIEIMLNKKASPAG